MVEDSAAQRRLLAAILRRWGLRVSEARNGAEALALCTTDPPDLVLSDWMMPVMDGPAFCRAFRDLPRDYGYFILLTSREERNAVAEGLDAGADDFLTKPVDPQELRARIAAGARILDMQRQLSDRNRQLGATLAELQGAHARINDDLVQARRFQQSLVPERLRDFGTLRLSLLLEPCGHIGGDLVGMFAAGAERAGFYSIDVAGHGIASALMCARIGAFLSGLHGGEQAPALEGMTGQPRLRRPPDLAMTLNRRLLQDSEAGEYLTMCYGTVDLASGRVDLVQAGHPHPLLLRRDGSSVALGPGGLPVGVLADASWPSFSLRLEPGERLLLHSDGLDDAAARGVAPPSEQGLARLLQSTAQEAGISAGGFLDGLFARLRQSLPRGEGFADDISAVLLEYDGPQGGSP
ncbi:sigma-B regulation protein RsbU (phosphoserine phosphatase) [Pontibaca methylaminivorans]|uniref:Sigma-B regulation protein RsbU (Phosphoserine phosphatase) n=1 Tax=Pontibaca methylaminivorans TaxID=515897 RepID=A0A1R3W8P3_9RHOB|nr:sigma-B regulation protein RsbU (phosphoserine phosphatase) [Pontibaca methylaminivorans]